MDDQVEVVEVSEVALALPEPEPAPHDADSFERLEVHKENIVKCLVAGDAIMFAIAREVRAIEAERLYEVAGDNPRTEQAYRSMREYLPDLIEELKARAKLHKLSRRQLYEYLALDRVFVEGLGIPAQEIMRLGPSHFTEIREALDYDPRTGEIAAEPREGKIGAETALRYVEELKEAVDNGAEWHVRDLAAALDRERGVQRRTIQLTWGRGAAPGTVYLAGVTIWEDGRFYEARTGISEEMATWLTRKAGATASGLSLGGEEV